MSTTYYIASCTFTIYMNDLSIKIQDYVQKRFGMTVVRCCTPKFRVQHFTECMPENYRPLWSALPESGSFQPGDIICSPCHNCLNIISETHPEVRTISLWELILSDSEFRFPDYSGLEATLQDCWRSRKNAAEHDAVRRILEKMNIRWREIDDCREKADFCGLTLFQPQPPRNPALAPNHYAVDIEGKFLPHTREEQKQKMEEHCRQFTTDTVICYCQYCYKGLKIAAKDARYLGEMLFR